jgi:hypothetical protein
VSKIHFAIGVGVAFAFLAFAQWAPPTGRKPSSLFTREPLRFIYTKAGQNLGYVLGQCEQDACAGADVLRVHIPTYDFLQAGLEKGYYRIALGLYPSSAQTTCEGQSATVYVNGEPVAALGLDTQPAKGSYVLSEPRIQRYKNWDLLMLPIPADIVQRDNAITVLGSGQMQWEPAVAAFFVDARTDIVPWWTKNLHLLILPAGLALGLVGLCTFYCYKSLVSQE